ncbi:MAG: hypothetical protein RL077_4099 [Verrucomicrobiota bacterium]|jgi:hypothetical protein
MSSRSSIFFLTVAALLSGGSARGFGALDLEFFEKKIRPILAARCYECHSDEKKIKAGLRLDTPEGWLRGGDSGPAVIPGNVAMSPLIKAVRYTGLDFEAMPPKSALPPGEVALLEEWVKRGAPAPAELGAGSLAAAPTGAARPRQVGLSLEAGRKFWSFVAPVSPPVPVLAPASAAFGSAVTVAVSVWPRSPIDHFIAARWVPLGLQAAPDAARSALLRRATFDLTGLPPTLAALDAFLADPRPTPLAFTDIVDGLLASPHFGERWGRHWLDVARFAESSGGGRTLMFKDAWRYRDYVISAFNRDMPFNQFIREQLAGDLLPAATPADQQRQLVATAFLTLGPTNYEEQNKDALRMDIVDEQIDTIGKGFLGMTIGCARCHDHKFDPIPTRDYYALAGILRSTHTLHNYTDNVARWVELNLPVDGAGQTALVSQEAQVAALESRLAKLRVAAKGSAGSKDGVTEALAGLVIDDAQAKVVGGWRNSQTVAGFIGAGYLTDDNENKGQKTVTFTPTIVQSGRYEVRLAYTAQANRASNVPVTILHADGEHSLVVNERQAPPVAGHFASLGTFRFEKEGQGYILISTEGTDGHVIVDGLQLVAADDRAEVPASSLVKAGTAEKTKTANELKRLEAELKRLTASGPKRPQTMGVREAKGEIGDTEIRIRGVARSLGPKVPRGWLQVAGSASPAFSESESGRRELADWIASEQHPLTARVFVNRAWAWLLGAGLVRTVDNFGTTGEGPSHPELLDYLARQFVADGWSVKKMVRAIVLSRTYQLGSASAPEARELDPDNRWLARAHRRRLEAEEIRDAILWTSGQLDLAVGGTNFGGVGDAPPSSEYGYVFADMRRSVYTPAFRNRRLELFEVFDFADINASIGQRSATTVAPQSLFLMNHPFVIAQAVAAARQTLARPARDEAACVDDAYRRALGRGPTASERALALRFLGVAKPAGLGTSAAASAELDEVARLNAWTEFHQSLFACIDFRYLN